MVLGAVRLRTWARPERARGPVEHDPAGHGCARRGKARRVTARRGRSWGARMVVGQVRFLTRARRESACGWSVSGWPRSGLLRPGTACMGAAWIVPEWLRTARLGWWLGWSQAGFDSLPEHGPKGLTQRSVKARRGRARRGAAGLGRARKGAARHGERYWQTPGFKSPERTVRKDSRPGLARRR